MGNDNFQSLFGELADYEKKGVQLAMEDNPASPMQIVNAHILREDVDYMRDYVLDEEGDVKKLCFYHIGPKKDAFGCEYPSK